MLTSGAPDIEGLEGGGGKGRGGSLEDGGSRALVCLFLYQSHRIREALEVSSSRHRLRGGVPAQE